MNGVDARPAAFGLPANDAGTVTAAAGSHPWIEGAVSEREALIVAGGYRCGTTSLFNHLAAHPEIDPALIKEPGFFFSVRLREQPPAYPPGHEAWAYLSMFRRKGARVLLEGTSNYLNDPGCAARIARGLPRAKVILLLREPVARLQSWYTFMRLQGRLAASMSFDGWIREMLADPRPVHERPYRLQALEHCRYSAYVAEFLRDLGPERVLLIWFDDLRRDPRAVLQRVCRYAGLAPGFYEHFDFPVQNESMQMRRPRAFAAYRRLVGSLLRVLRPWPRAQHELKLWLFGRFEPRILSFFTAPAAAVAVDDAVRLAVQEHLRSDLAPLCAVAGADAPWRAAYERGA